MFAMIVIPEMFEPLAWLMVILAGLGGILLAYNALRGKKPDDGPKPDPSKAKVVPVGKGKNQIVRKEREMKKERVVKEEPLPRDCEGNIIPLQDDWHNGTKDLKL